MSDLVVGRYGIDRGFIKTAIENKYDIISATEFKSYHLGLSSATKANMSDSNWLYNYQYLTGQIDEYVLKTQYMICNSIS